MALGQYPRLKNERPGNGPSGVSLRQASSVSFAIRNDPAQSLRLVPARVLRRGRPALAKTPGELKS